MRGLWLLIGGLVLVLGSTLGGVYYWLQSRKPAPPAPAAQAVELAPGAEIRVDAKIQAQHLIDVAPGIDGVFAEAPVKPDDEVSEGQVLGRIQNQTLEEDEKEAQAETESALNRKNAAESNLLAARLEESRASAEASRARAEFQRLDRIYQRQVLLYREGATPRVSFEKAEKEYQTARSDMETLESKASQIQARIEGLVKEADTMRQALAEKEAELEEARSALKSAEIVSPVNGIVVAITKQPGDEVKKSAPDLFKIAVDLSFLRAVAELAPPILKRLQIGQEAIVQIAELPGEGLPGTIAEVTDERVVVDFASPSPLIRPGMSAVLRLKLR